MRKIAEADANQEVIAKAPHRRRSVQSAALLAACLLVALLAWKATEQDGANQVFAGAMDSIQRARTFSCKRVEEHTVDDQKKVREILVMFKEPNLERRVELTNTRFPQFNGEVTVTDYGKRQEMRLVPERKTAYFTDNSSSYVIDEGTGKVKLPELDTSLRDQLLRWSEGEVEDLGSVELHDRTVRLLQSRGDKWTVKIWIDPKTKLPVQARLDRPGLVETYTSIQINSELDDEFFSFHPPDGYELKKVSPGWSDYQMKLNAKMSYLTTECWRFRGKNDGQFPQQLSDLKTVGVKKQVLNTLLASPGQSDGPAVIHYRQPPAGADFSSYVLLHEVFDTWPKEGALVVGFVDGHRSLVDQEHFKQLVP